MSITHQEISLAINSECLLGESPIWSPEESSVYFIDIKKPSINKLQIKTEIFTTFAMPSEIGSIALNNKGGLVIALKMGLALFDPTSLGIKVFSTIDKDFENNRPNEGKCDRAGRLWVASMDNFERSKTGQLWKISMPHDPVVMEDGFVIGNGIDWSPDSKKMYFTDSVNRVIYVYDFDLDSGQISNKKIFTKVAINDGYPDGLTVDSEGFIWIANWDGWKITRYKPNGLIDQFIWLPVPRPTSLTFGGENLKTLFVTSARIGLTKTQLSIAPLSGGLFKIKTKVKGLSGNRFRVSH